MTGPTPQCLLWGIELLLLAGALVAAGDGARLVLRRWIPFFGPRPAISSVVLDLYLAGGLLFVVAVASVGAFTTVPVLVVLVAFVAFGVVTRLRWTAARRRPIAVAPTAGIGGWELVAVGSALLLYVVEILATNPVASGNTFDASVESLFVALLQLHGSIPTSLAPVASGSIAYPQGPTVWFAAVGAAGSLSGPRLTLLVAPLFLATMPLSAYCVGRSWLGSSAAGGAFAAAAAILGPASRTLVTSGTDLAVGLPLAIWLLAEIPVWTSRSAPAARTALGFGLVTGLTFTLAPVGAEWVLLLVALAGAVAIPRYGGDLVRWWSCYGAMLAVSFLFAIPTVVGLAGGATGGPSTTLGAPSIVAFTDPFLYRPEDLALSPFPLEKAELTVLLLLAVVLLALGEDEVGPWMVRARRPVAVAIGGGLLAVGTAVALGLAPAPFSVLSGATSASELSILLFTIYGLVAAIPLAVAFEAIDSTARPSSLDTSTTDDRRLPRLRRMGAPVAIVVALVVVLPGVATTTVQLPSYLSSSYAPFTNVSSNDVRLLEWGGAHLPAGARVLVAPGSAAEFLPAYQPRVSLLFPMTGPDWTGNATYVRLCGLLENGSLGATGESDLLVLDVGFVLVTGQNSVLYRPFSAGPLLADPSATVQFEAGDDYAFAIGENGP